MRRILSIVTFMAVWSAITVFAISYGAFYNWPDYVHTDYGFPVTWGTHTTSTFAGPADKWTVDTNAMALDLAIWLIAMIVVVSLIYLFLGRTRASAKS